MRTGVLIISAIAAGAVSSAAVLRAAGADLTLAAATPAGWVLGLAGLAVAATLGLAKLLRLPERARELAGEPLNARGAAEALADLAEVSRARGLLVAASDPRAGQYPLFRPAVHLIARDVDAGLLRSTLENTVDTTLRRRLESRLSAARAAKVGGVALGLGAAAAAAVLAAAAGDPGSLGTRNAGLVAGALAGFFVWYAAGSPLRALLLRRNAEESLISTATIEAAMAMHAGLSRAEVAERLGRLLPEDGTVAASAASARLAA